MILDLIAAVSSARGDAPAIEEVTRSVTYAQLAMRSNALAARLIAAGVGAEVCVGVCTRPSIETVVAMIATLKAGGAFVMLDATYPQPRLEMMLADARPQVVLVDESHRDLPVLAGHAQLVIGRDEAPDAPAVTLVPEQLAYVVFTSGSTGRPKGVAVTHTGIANLVANQIAAFALDASSRTLQFAALGFDAIVSEVFTALGAGGTLCIEQRGPSSDIAELLVRRRISVVTLPPSLLRILPDVPTLRTIVAAGEACSAELVERWAAGHRMVNAYGPSECTVCATQKVMASSHDTPTIGRAIAGIATYVLDDALAPAARGELYLAGIGLGRGYLGPPALTAERFVPDPAGTGTRMYRTGDVVHREGDELAYAGRTDDQLKLRGFRVEPREIEDALRTANIADVVVLPRQRANGDIELVAYVVTASLDEPALREHARARLPLFLRPAQYVAVERWPLTANGKIDRAALAELRIATTAPVPPRTPEEARIAAIVEAVLDRNVDLDRSLFDQGGDSIAAVRVAIAVSAAFAITLPLGALFAHRDLRALAAQLAMPQIAGCIELRSGRGRPIWMPAPVHGSSLCYMRLADQLGPEIRAIGLQAPGVDGEAEPIADFVALATHHITTIRAQQPEGPYRLAGWSMGGSMAFEIAVQLERAGETVSLALIGSTPPSPDHLEAARATMKGYETWRMAYFYLRSLAFSLDQPIALDFDEFSALPEDQVIDRLVTLLHTLGPLGLAIDRTLAQRWLAVVRANLYGFHHQTPTGAFAGPTLQLLPTGANPLTRDNLVRSRAVPAGSWNDLLRGPVETHAVGGNHYTVMLEPWVDGVAKRLVHWASR